MSAVSLGDLGWVLADKGASCTSACVAEGSTCHIGSHKAVDSKSEMQHALTHAGKASIALTLVNSDFCFYDEDFAPAVVIPVVDKNVLHYGYSSACDAVPSGDFQRLCCCSPTGCTTSG
jgi:hypothetical protein